MKDIHTLAQEWANKSKKKIVVTIYDKRNLKEKTFTINPT